MWEECSQEEVQMRLYKDMEEKFLKKLELKELGKQVVVTKYSLAHWYA
jgi:hypothetical protein